ncbi:MAG TPA: sialidase family protein, partial [Candidatus Polarisedimenticolaceae bacterium]|nr:sialidase family protein [Candidatus Polarisedimenticolaceae bacterium]
MIANTIDNDRPGATLVDQIRCSLYNSQDAGASWSEVPAWPETPLIRSLYDPWVAVGADGTMYATCIAIVPNGSGQVAFIKSIDQGLTWTPPTIVTPYDATTGADKSVIEVGSDGRLLVCYRQASRVILSQSLDQGLTWTTKSTGLNGHCAGISSAPGGYITLAVMYGSSLTSYGTLTSSNNGTSWAAVRNLGTTVYGSSPSFPSIVRDYTGRTVITDVNSTAKQMTISTEANNGSLLTQWQLTKPSSSTCSSGRLVHPQLTIAPNRLPALQVMCKISPTTTTAGKQEIWFYPVINQSNNSSAPILVNSTDLPPQSPPVAGSLASRFPDGGYFWDFTWRADGWVSMWIDPRQGKGIGELMAAPV